MAHALDAAILSLFAVSGILCFADLGMSTFSLKQQFSRVKESHALALAITSLF